MSQDPELLRRLLRAKDRMDAASHEEWSGRRTFRDVTGETPSELRAHEKAAPHALERVPACFVSAARRPDLTIAISEKRRQQVGGTHVSETEVP